MKSIITLERDVGVKFRRKIVKLLKLLCDNFLYNVKLYVFWVSFFFSCY